MTDYTPTTEAVRDVYAESRYWRARQSLERAEQFDRWLDAHDAEKRAEWEAEQGTEEPEWEYGVLFADYRTEPSFVGAEDSARYFMGRPNSALDKNALPDDRKVLVCRRKAGPWERALDAEQGGEDR